MENLEEMENAGGERPDIARTLVECHIEDLEDSDNSERRTMTKFSPKLCHKCPYWPGNRERADYREMYGLEEE